MMRLDILEHGYRPTTKLLFQLVRTFTGQPLPDAARLTFYRPDFYGKRAKEFTQAAMRGPSPWSVADRELMAAYVSVVNDTAFCIGAHTATAALAYGDEAKVRAILQDPESAAIGEPLRATLRMLDILTRTGTVSAAQMRAVLSAGATREQVEDALAVCAAFNITDRLADAFGFAVLSPAGFESGAKYLLKRGYR
ncbi:carboxymuconolactone decarboxylase family protein [Nocardia vermiculata]|nr:carboxymuconolactone decarboxylase family protein [Nocardia vermiculata]